GGSAEPAPATGAAAVVPADALAYVHVSIDTTRPAVRRATTLGARLPGYPRLLASVFSRLSAIAGGGAAVDYNRDIRPWLGKEAAFAVLDTTGSSAGSLIVLDVSRHAQAQRFLTAAGASAAGTYAGVRLYRYPTGTELAFVRHYLA